jgi:hypothetical protein
VFLLRSDLSEANLRGADLRQADLSGAYLKDTILSEANLNDAYLLESYLIRTKLDQAELTGCCIHSWHLEEVDLSKVKCHYLFTRFDQATKKPCDRYPSEGHLQPGELSQENTENSLTVDVRFINPPNWEVLGLTLTQVVSRFPGLQLAIKSYEMKSGQYVLRLSASRLVNTNLLSRTILRLYPEILERFMVQRPTILNLLGIKEDPELKMKSLLQGRTKSPLSRSSAEYRQRMYEEVVNQIQRIILSQSPEQFVDSVQRLLVFLKQYNISTEEIQKKVIRQAIIRRAKKDEVFQKRLLQWEETADEAARFSIVGQAARSAIALLFSQAQSP